jgi:hypothetical protein
MQNLNSHKGTRGKIKFVPGKKTRRESLEFLKCREEQLLSPEQVQVTEKLDLAYIGFCGVLVRGMCDLQGIASLVSPHGHALKTSY